MFSNSKLAENTTIVIAQSEFDPEELVILNNASIETGFFSTCLEVTYTWNGEFPIVKGLYRETWLGCGVGLWLSLDNQAWIKVAQHVFDSDERQSNMTKSFSICNSLIHPFPFDVDKGRTLYVTIEFQVGPTGLGYPDMIRLPPLAIVVPEDITRLWYFTIDWTLPGIFGAIFLDVFAVFLMSRHHRKSLERRLNKRED